MIRVCTINDKEILEKYYRKSRMPEQFWRRSRSLDLTKSFRQYILIRKNEILTPRESKNRRDGKRGVFVVS